MKKRSLHIIILCIYFLINCSTADERFPEKIFSVNYTVNSIAGSDHYIAVGADNNMIYLFDKNGDLIWSRMLSENTTSVSIDKRNEFIASTTLDKKLFLHSIAGDREWNAETEDYLEYSKALSVSGDTVAAGTRTGFIHLIQEGEEKWRIKADSYILQVKIDDNLVKAVSDKRVYIFNLEGRLLLNRSFPDYIRSTAVSREYVAAGLGNNELYLIDNTGNLLWNTFLPDQIGVIDSSDYVVCGLRNGEVYIYDLNGKQINRFRLDGPVVSISTYASKVVADTLNENLYILDVYGDVEWSQETQGYIKSSIITRNYLMAGSTMGEIYHLRIFKDPEQMRTVTVIVVLGLSIATIILVLSLRN